MSDGSAAFGVGGWIAVTLGACRLLFLEFRDWERRKERREGDSLKLAERRRALHATVEPCIATLPSVGARAVMKVFNPSQHVAEDVTVRLFLIGRSEGPEPFRDVTISRVRATDESEPRWRNVNAEIPPDVTKIQLSVEWTVRKDDLSNRYSHGFVFKAQEPVGTKGRRTFGEPIEIPFTWLDEPTNERD